MSDYVKSPLNYMGGKYKLLEQMLPLFPKNIHMFVDLFGGGFNVGINVPADVTVYNDKCQQLFDLIYRFYISSSDEVHTRVMECSQRYDLLRRDNPDGYMALRDDFNELSVDFVMLFTLIACSFNNQLRFNKSGNFNVPYGKRFYNEKMQKNLLAFLNKMNHMDIQFFGKSFREFDYSMLQPGDFVYVDPPYYNSVAGYNENGGWTAEDEADLLHQLDLLTDAGIQWGLSNNLKLDNPYLKDWLCKNRGRYTVYYLNNRYSNCNYHKKDRNSNDIEVLVVNY